MNEKETVILEKLEAGDFDGFCPPSRSYGNANCGGVVNTGYLFNEGKIIEYRDVTYKIFDGKENERTTERTTRVIESDWERLDVLAKLGYRMDDPDANEYSQTYYDERRRQKAEERAAMKAAAERRDEARRAECATLPVGEEYTQSDLQYYEGTETESYDDQNTDNADIDKAVLILAAVAGTIYGVIKLAPHAKKWWKESAAPGIKNAWNKITRKDPFPENCVDDKTDEEKPVDDSSAELNQKNKT